MVEASNGTPATARPKERISLGTFFLSLGLVVVVAVVAIVGITFTASMRPQITPTWGDRPNASAYEPRNAQERELFANLRIATEDEADLLVLNSMREGVPATLVAYIATGDIMLPRQPLEESITIALPEGKRWIGGPLTNEQLVFATPMYWSPILSLTQGHVVRNEMCHVGVVKESLRKACLPELWKPATPEEMHANLRRLSPTEYAAHPALQHIPHYLPGDEVYITTGNVVLAPHLNREIGKVILVADGHEVIGGQPGALIVLSDFDVSASRLPTYIVMIDPTYREWVGVAQDLYCPFMSATVQEQYYPHVC